MSGKKGTKHFSTETKAEIEQLRIEGKSHREIGAQVGLSLSQIRKYFERQHKRARDIENGYSPKPKGRPRKQELTPKARIRELEREVEMLRAFLHAAGRM